MSLFDLNTELKSLSREYNAQSIEVLKGLDPVKHRPGMYTDTSGPDHLAFEVIDNSVDEAIAGYAEHIDLVLKADGSVIVTDNGRGMPVDIHPEEKISGVELIMSTLHAGAKFSNKDYNYSGGLHGVGVSVVNALSSQLSVHIKRDGYLYHIAFKNGFKTKDLSIVKEIEKNETGTSVHFYPNYSYFEKADFSKTALKTVLKSKAVLCNGLTTTFLDEASGEKSIWQYKQGINEYLEEYFKDIDCLLGKAFTGDIKTEDIQISFAVNWSTTSGIASLPIPQESYVNLIHTRLGGTHINGFRAGLLESIKDFCKFRNLMPKGMYLNPEDIWDNIGYILSVKLSDVQFSGQTKERLSSGHCSHLVMIQIRDAFTLWLNQNIEDGEKLIQAVIENAKNRIAKATSVSRKKSNNGMSLPAKLADCTNSDKSSREIFFVEGDSAGGSARQARDRRFQAIMPLRGKILNTWDLTSSQIIESKEIIDIARVLGVMPGSEDISGLRYNKICILADADSDGLHIATLLCALFLKHFLPVVKQGHVFIAMPPLFRINLGKEIYYALDESEKNNILKRISQRKKNGQKKTDKIHIQRFKGLGEMNPAQLRETTIAPDSRRLIQLCVDNDSEEGLKAAVEVMDILLGKKRIKDRKIWIENNGT
jgi:topoisomerase IV subunit B